LSIKRCKGEKSKIGNKEGIVSAEQALENVILNGTKSSKRIQQGKIVQVVLSRVG